MIEKTDQVIRKRLLLNLRQVEVFLATVHSGSTRAAAESVSRSQSAVSTALAELEAALDVELFDRIGHRLALNENGRALLPKAQSLVDQAWSLQNLFLGEHEAPLRVAASFTIGEYLLPKIVSKWSKAHPNCPIYLRIGNTSEVLASVAALEVDVGFVEGAQTHPDVVSHEWLDDSLVVVAAPDHPLARKKVTKHDLSNASWVMRELGSGTRQFTDAWLLKHIGSIRVGLELGSSEAIKSMVAASEALACLSHYAVQQSLNDGYLIKLDTYLPELTRPLAIAQHQKKQLGRVTQDFIAHCHLFKNGVMA